MVKLRWLITSSISLVAAIALLLICSGGAQALMLKMSLEELTDGADSVVVGTVVSTNSYWNADQTRIYTEVVISVEDRLKGTEGQNAVTIVVPGGTVGDKWQWMEDTPTFTVGEKVGLFLEDLNTTQIAKMGVSTMPQIAAAGTPTRVYGSAQGKFSFSEDRLNASYIISVDRFKQNVSLALAGQMVPELQSSPEINETIVNQTISNITPNIASAGTNTTVTVTGSDFGATQGSSELAFFCYQDTYGDSYLPAEDIISWSNTQIQAYVPIGDRLLYGYDYSAASGPVRVYKNGTFGAAYPFTVTFGNGLRKWAGTGPTVTYFVNPAGDATKAVAVQAAANSWSNAGANFSFSYSGATSAINFAQNGVNEIFWTDLGSGILGGTAIYGSGSTIPECDVGFNTDYSWSTLSTCPTGSYDVQTVGVHELGHWLFLRDLYGNKSGYPQDVNKIMYGFGSSGQMKRTLHAHDILGIKYIYGNAPVNITTVNLIDATINLAYSQTLQATGGTGTYTWSITTGSLPAGLTLAPATGVISGTPTTLGTSNFTVQATDGASTATKPLSITVSILRNLVGTNNSSTDIVTPNYIHLCKFTASATGTISQIRVYSAASGNAKVAIFADSNNEPGSLLNANNNNNSLSPNVWNNITIADTSVTSGTAYWLGAIMDSNCVTKITATNPRRVRVQNYSGFNFTGPVTGTTVANTVYLCIAAWGTGGPSPLTITTASLPDGTVNVAYSETLQASGGSGSYTWSVTSGSLPAGLTLTGATGLISGTPSTVATSNFTVQVNDGSTTAFKPLSITIDVALLKLVGTENSGTDMVSPNYVQLSRFIASTTGFVSRIKVYSAGSGNVKVAIYKDNIGEPGDLLNANNNDTAVSPGKWNNVSIAATYVTSGTAYWLGAITDSSSVTRVTATNPRRYLAQTYSGYTWPSTLAGLSTSDNMYLCISAWGTTGPPPLTITTGSLQAGTVGSAYSQTLQASGGTGSYAWSVISGSLPDGLTLSGATGLISGTPTTSGTSDFTVQVDDGSTTASKALSILINSSGPTPLTITTTLLSNGIINVEYVDNVEASGGSGDYAWTLIDGALPDGLTLTTSIPGLLPEGPLQTFQIGLISGTPTAIGTFNFTVQVDDSSTTVSKPFSITINSGATALAITTDTLSDGEIGIAYSQTLQATGGTETYAWSITSGSLPDGLTLTSETGLISGTPTTAATSNFTVQVDDGYVTVSKALSIIVTVPLERLAGTDTSSTTVVAPNYIQLSKFTASATGTIRRIKVYAAASGNVKVAIYADNGGQPGGLMNANSNNNAVLPNQWNNISIADTFVTSGTAYWLGAIMDTNSVTRVTATNPRRYKVQTYAGFTWPGTLTGLSTNDNMYLCIAAWGIPGFAPLTITTSSLASGTVGVAYSQTLQANGGSGSYAWSVTTGSLPDGLTLTQATGLISGTPTTAATSNFTVQVDDGFTTASKPLSIIVNSPPLTITTNSLPDGTVGVAYSQTLQANGGSGSYAWSVTTGSLPDGLTLTGATGLISGTPTTAATSDFTVQVDDGSTTTSKPLSIIINSGAAPLTITTNSLPDGTVGVAYSQILQASGGTGSYTWSVTTGSLPDGLTLTGTTGLISGTPTTSASFNFTVQVNDGSTTDDQSLSININPAVTTERLVGTGTSGTDMVSPNYIQLSKFTASATGTVSQIRVYGAGSGNVKVAIYADNNNQPGGLMNANSNDNAITAGQWNNISIADTSVISGTAYWLGAIMSNSSVTRVTAANPRRYKAQTYAGFTWPATLTDLSTSDNMYLCIAGWGTTGLAPLTITTASLANGTVGVAYSQTLQATGGSGSYTWSVTTGSLPNGLTLTGATGLISGTPTTSGNSNFTVQVNDGSTTDDQSLSININPADTAERLVGTGTSGTDTVAPNYIQLSKFTASATGTVSQIRVYSAGSGNVKVAIYADNNNQPGDLMNANSNDNAVTAGQWNNISITGTSVTSGTAYWLGAIMDSNCVTKITATNPRRYKAQTYAGFTWPATLTDLSTSDNMYLCIAGWGITGTAPLIITTGSLPDGTVGAVYFQTLQASGGSGSYAWSVTTGSLPNGLTLAGATGLISGTPTTAATSNFTVQVNDGSTNASKAFSIIVNSAGTGIQKLVGTSTSGTGAFSSNYIGLSQFTASMTGNVTELRVYGTHLGRVKVAIYSDLNGEPGALIRANNNNNTVLANQWNTISITSTPVTSGTAYWLGVIFDANNSVTKVSYTNPYRYKTQAYTGFSWPTNLSGLITSDTVYLCIGGWGTAGP